VNASFLAEKVRYVSSREDVLSNLDGGPAIFLSAGVPYMRPLPQGVPPEETRLRARENEVFVENRAPEDVIRSAVVLLAREALRRGVRLVCGAQPAIGSMLLSIGLDVVGETQAQPHILIFQSRYFEADLPASTLDLARGEAGLLVLTPEVTVTGASREAGRDPSLKLMRQLMMSVPNLKAAVLIGGMDGVTHEAALFRQYNPDAPVVPLPSTGSAARMLYDASPQRYKFFDSASVTGEPISYSLVAKDILDYIMRGGVAPNTG
jgi:hypothetical protein